MTNQKSKSSTALLLTLCAAILLSSCGAILNLRQMTDGSLWHKATDTYFIPCSVSLRAYKVDSLYGKNEKTSYYSVKFEDKERFIAEKDDIGGTVYRHQDVPEINIENFGAVAAQIYITGKVRIQVGELLASPDLIGDTSNIANYQDGTEKVNAVVDAMINSVSVTMPADVDEDRVFEIGLLSADYPGLVYTVYFLLDMQGNAYLNDRETRAVVKCPDIVKKYMLSGSALDPDESADATSKGEDK